MGDSSWAMLRLCDALRYLSENCEGDEEEANSLNWL